MNWLHYLLEANIYLAVFYAGYCLFLNRETYYTLNRIYLLLSCLISFLLPLVQVGILKPTVHETINAGYLTSPTNQDISIQYILFYTYLLGSTILLGLLLFKVFKLVKITQTTSKTTDNRYKIVVLEDSNTAFSFFNYLFIGSKTAGTNTIIRHEMVHIRQKHTLDVLFLEFIKIINWFNPIVYLLQNSLKTVHEYIADEQTAAFESDILAYSSFLVNNAYGLSGSSIAPSFFNYNLLKKRIIMLNQKRSGNLARLKYLVAVPICAGALCASTLGFSKTYALVDLVPQHLDTIIKAKRGKVPPPPPTPPAKKSQITVVKFPPPKVKVTKPQPPPPPPPVPPTKKNKAAAIKFMPPKIVKDPPAPSKPVEEIQIDESPVVSKAPPKVVKDVKDRPAKIGVTIRTKSDTLNNHK
ncbi:M56 family metallopeptidase [Mucilaginibacter sp. HC2]|uniref:M56 family metallopeptidase n=1 Tax=Mucilaginibacter inviolabilis TaxID=2714892 RepID=UPI00140A3FBD|nr:M56 family metallopeptidase [Mucilaginibacter inviolabilis]NHA07121.1 M56 family metallopeptidase [Mucilaginibacter inviolabilis]